MKFLREYPENSSLLWKHSDFWLKNALIGDRKCLLQYLPSALPPARWMAFILKNLTPHCWKKYLTEQLLEACQVRVCYLFFGLEQSYKTM